MIKNYFTFLNENNSLGEYIESEFSDNEYALSIISKYTKNIDPTIKLSNAINLLPISTQKSILNQINNKGTKSVDITAYTDISENVGLSGKNMFKCFMKVLTALGCKDTKSNWSEIPNNFSFYFKSKSIDVLVLKNIMSRYSYFNDFISSIDYTHNECYLYYGLKVDGNFEYGILTDNFIPIGLFKITKKTYNWLITLDSPSSNNLKKELISLEFDKFYLLGKIKTEMLKYGDNISNQQMIPIINNGIITFGYKGVGNWSNGNINDSDLEKFKTSIKLFLSKYKWSEKIQVSIKQGNDFWILVNIKIK